MLLHPLFVLVNGVFGRLATAMGYISGFSAEVGTLTIPWPFPFLPTAPFLGALVVATFATIFFFGIKLVRWLYGLTPFLQ